VLLLWSLKSNIFCAFQGKTMSLLCGALKWLHDHEARFHLYYEVDTLNVGRPIDNPAATNWFQSQAAALEERKCGLQALRMLEKLSTRNGIIANFPEELKQLQVNMASIFDG
jgi:hypothetical protein